MSKSHEGDQDVTTLGEMFGGQPPADLRAENAKLKAACEQALRAEGMDGDKVCPDDAPSCWVCMMKAALAPAANEPCGVTFKAAGSERLLGCWRLPYHAGDHSGWAIGDLHGPTG